MITKKLRISFQEAAQLAAERLIQKEKIPEGVDIKVDFHIGKTAGESELELEWADIEDAEIVDGEV